MWPWRDTSLQLPTTPNPLPPNQFSLISEGANQNLTVLYLPPSSPGHLPDAQLLKEQTSLRPYAQGPERPLPTVALFQVWDER